MIALSRIAPGDHVELCAPEPGLFRAAVAIGDVVRPGLALGVLEILGRAVELVAPDTAHGAIVALADPSSARPAVGYGDLLVRVDPTALPFGGADGRARVPAIGPHGLGETTGPDVSTAPTDAAGGPVFRAPTSGRYYARPSPDKPAFVEVGAQLSAGATVCLLEIMKTFHRVTYSGAPARVRALLVAEGADVNAGDPLLALEP